jgi:hypothetical protein
LPHREEAIKKADPLIFTRKPYDPSGRASTAGHHGQSNNNH